MNDHREKNNTVAEKQPRTKKKAFVYLHTGRKGQIEKRRLQNQSRKNGTIQLFVQTG